MPDPGSSRQRSPRLTDRLTWGHPWDVGHSSGDMSATLRLGARSSRMTRGSPLSPLLLGCLLLAAGMAGALAARPGSGPEQKGAARCPSNWQQYRGYCYGYFTQKKTWAEAEEACRVYGPEGHLASLHSPEATTVLAQYASNQEDNKNTWIGFHYQIRAWKWSDYSTVDYINWASGQPKDKDCAVLDVDSGFELWRDYPCEFTFPFLCQYKP